MDDHFRATQDGDVLYLEGCYSTPYPDYEYKITGITVNDDGTVEVQVNVFDPAPGTIRPCVVGTVEVYEELSLFGVDGFNGQELHTLHLVSTGTYTPEIDVHIDRA